MQTLKKLVPHTLELLDGDLRLKRISLFDLTYLSNHQQDEAPRLSCRPIVEKSDREQKKFYKGLLKSDVLVFFGIYLSRGGKETLAGKIELSDYNSRNKSAEVGYMLLDEYRNQRYMKKALTLLIDYLFRKAPDKLNKIYAQTGDFNAPSIALLTSLGFKCDGRLRQHHELSGVLHDDFIFSLCQSDLEKPAGES